MLHFKIFKKLIEYHYRLEKLSFRLVKYNALKIQSLKLPRISDVFKNVIVF